MKKLHFAINTAGRNKDWDFRKLSGRFRDRSGTLADVIHHVQQGHALCTAQLGGQWRSKGNFVSSQWILSEIDNSGLLRDEAGNVVIGADGKGVKVYEPQLTIEEALEHPFVKAHCALIYTTPSHRLDWHRFRLVWPLPEVVTDINTYEAAIRLVLAQVPHDPACKDGVRVFYGNTNAEFPLINPAAVLPADWIDLAIDIADQEKRDRAEREQLQALKRNQFRQLAQDEGWDTDALILQALSLIPPRSIGGGNYHECAPVLMALADHYGTTEAERIAEQWSPSIKGSTWNIGQKLKSFRRSGITIGTLFYIALKHGFKFPERRQPLPVGEPDAAAYNAYRDWEDEQERIEAAIDKERSFERLLKLFGHKKRVKVERAIAPLDAPPTPAHEYAAGDRLDTWREAIEQDYRYILDQSGTGTGKSFDSGKLEPHSFGAKQAIYLSPQHRNPTVETLTADNGWIDLEARHAGLTREPTPGGGHRLKRTGKGEIPTVPANCNRTGIINALRGKHVQGADTASLICGTCSLKEACQNTVRGGYGFLNQRQSALSAPKLRAHPDSLPSPDGYPIDEAILLHDEAGETFTTKRGVVVTMQDVAQTIAALLKAGVLESVEALLTVLLNHLDGTTKAGRYGLNHTEAVKLLGDVKAIDIAAIERVLQPDLSFLNTTAEYGVDLADLPANLRKKFADRDRNGAVLAEERVVKQWLPDLLRILQGQTGSLHLGRNALTISLPDDRHRAIAAAAKANIFLDATLNREDLALKLKCHPDEIFVCRQHIPDADNLRLIQVTDLGRLGRQRGDDQQRRVSAIVDHFQQLDPTTKAIDFKQEAAEGMGAWWRDSRGVNDFEAVKTLILIGTPCRNLADLQAEYAILTGCHDPADVGFKAFVDRQIRADIHQAIGRLRAHRRPDELLQVILLTNFAIDLPTEQISAEEITPDAADKVQRIILAAQRAIEHLQSAGKKLTQAAVAAIVGCTPARISQLREFINFATGDSNSEIYHSGSSPPDPDVVQVVEAIATQASMDEVLQSLSDMFFEWFQPQQWRQLWRQLSGKAQPRILEAVFLTLPESQREQIRRAVTMSNG